MSERQRERERESTETFEAENFHGMLKPIIGGYGTPKFRRKLLWAALKPRNS